MADNIQVTQGSGTTMATDEVGGAHYPYVKLAFGDDDTATKVSIAAQLPVSVDSFSDLTDAVGEKEVNVPTIYQNVAQAVPLLEEIRNVIGPEPQTQVLAQSSYDSYQTLLDIKALLAAAEPPVIGVARQLAAGATSANTALGGSVSQVTMRAVGADIRYQIGASAQTATASSHFIAQDERVTIAVPAGANIAVIRNASTDGTLELSELA